MRHRLISVAVGFTLLITLGITSATPADASDGFTDTATQTYELRPTQHLVHVTISLAVKNTTPSTTEYYSCDKWVYDWWYGWYLTSSTCSQTTNYYINETSLWVEDGARNLKITADSGSVSKSVSTHSYGFTSYVLKFQRTFYGHTRKITATYDLPSAAPRSAGGIRAGQAYASFCVSGNGLDGGQIRVITPTGFSFSHTDSAGLTFSTSQSSGRTVYASGRISNPISAWSCFEGINVSGYASQTVQAPDGRSVIVAAWPEDPAWGAAVAADVRSSLPGLERLVGRSLPGTGSIAILEVGGLGDYGGFYYPETNIAVINEDFTQPGLTAHELSHAWFNDQNFKSTWLSEGYAEWVGSQNGGALCDRLPTFPGTGKPDLEAWSYLGPKSTATDRAVVDYQYDAACWVIASVADRIGTARMTAVLAALFDGTSAYGASGVTNTKPATWQAWLDAVDELGMVPAGETDLDLVQNELAEVGVAADSAQLAARSEARAAYHALTAEAAGWTVPDAVRAPLTSWNFGAADKAIQAAQRARSDVERADAALPEINALQGPIEAKWEAARTLGDLDAVATLAGQEASAAEAIAGARQLQAQADPITQLGLIGTDTSTMYTTAIAAARRVDPSAALASATQITSTIRDAQGAGWLRLTVGALGGTAIGLFFVVRLRRRRTLIPLSAGGQPAVAAPAAETTPLAASSDVIAEPAGAPQSPMTLETTRQSLDRLAALVTDPETARALIDAAPRTTTDLPGGTQGAPGPLANEPGGGTSAI
jgi:hypothetical protein